LPLGRRSKSGQGKIGNQELLVGFIGDRKRGGYRFIVFLSADLSRVIACIGLIVPLQDVFDADVTQE
jgi:hypothetical protein